jgi:hypothetical protein
MNPILSAGLLIGVLCGVWTFVMGFTGWYKDPVLANVLFIPVVVLLEAAALLWGLRKTAAGGRTYGGQIIAGTLMATIGGLVIICSSLLFTMVAFPDYFRELEAMQREMLAKQGMAQAEIDAAVQAAAVAATPMANAMLGFIMTLITGILATAIIAIFVRAKTPGIGARV